MNNKNYFFQEILAKNPVLVATIGLCPVVAIATSLKAAIIMSVITIITLIVAQTLTTLFLSKLPQWARLGLYTIVGMLVVVPSMLIVDKISPETMVALGIYFPLLAVNPLVVRNCEREAVDTGLLKSIFTSFCAGLGYSVVLIVVGFTRELLGAGKIWGIELKFLNPSSAFLMPVGGFIIIAYLASILRIYLRKVDPKLADELIENSRTNIKGSKKARLALRGAKYADGSTALPRQKNAKREKPEKKVTIKIPKIGKKQAIEEETKPNFEVMTLEEAEELRNANLPPVGTTVQAELAPEETKPEEEESVSTPVSTESQKATEKTSRFEFVTLDLSQDKSMQQDAERFAEAAAKSKEKKPQKQRIKRGQTKKVKEDKEGEE